MTLHMPPGVTRTLVGHAEECYPRECCGVLLGHHRKAVLKVVEALPVPNVAGALNRYAMSPASLLELERNARDCGLGIVGFYHSHPEGDAFPSAIDRDQAIPGTLHLILAMTGRGRSEQQAWMYRGDGGLEPVTLSTAMA